MNSQDDSYLRLYFLLLVRLQNEWIQLNAQIGVILLTSQGVVSQ